MKVLQLLPALEQGGVETVVLGLNAIVAAEGWQSVVVSAGGRLVERVVAAGGRHVRLDLKSKNPLTYFSRMRALRRLVAAERPDLVCVHSRVPAWLFLGANRTLRLPWITYAHGANSVSKYSEVMTRGDLTVVPSRFLGDYLKRNYALADEKLRIIHPAVDFDRFDPARLDAAFVASRREAWGIESDDFVVMAVGRIVPLKGYDALLRAVSEIRKTEPRAKVVLVGDADARHRQHLNFLKALAAELGLGRAAVFAGGESRIPECLSLAHVVVSSNTAKPESFGLSMAEALALGKPVVAKAFGGALDIVRDGVDGVLVQNGDFASAILKARMLPTDGLREAARARFSQSVCRARTLEIYTRAAERGVSAGWLE